MRLTQVFTVTISYDDEFDGSGEPYLPKAVSRDVDADTLTWLITGCPDGIGWYATVEVREST